MYREVRYIGLINKFLQKAEKRKQRISSSCKILFFTKIPQSTLCLLLLWLRLLFQEAWLPNFCLSFPLLPCLQKHRSFTQFSMLPCSEILCLFNMEEATSFLHPVAILLFKSSRWTRPVPSCSPGLGNLLSHFWGVLLWAASLLEASDEMFSQPQEQLLSLATEFQHFFLPCAHFRTVSSCWKADYRPSPPATEVGTF